MILFDVFILLQKSNVIGQKSTIEEPRLAKPEGSVERVPATRLVDVDRLILRLLSLVSHLRDKPNILVVQPPKGVFQLL